jgi:ligand-binding sensor domain-containing protein
MLRSHFIWSFWVISSLLLAQQPASIHLTEKDGLPDIEFYNLTEDSQHYIWLAADKGLYRYDGRNFTHYAHPKQKGNAVFGTKEDKFGRVWCNNISGQFFYAEDNKLNLFVDLGDFLNGELTEFIVTENELIVFPGKSNIRVDLNSKQIIKSSLENVFFGAMQATQSGYLFTKGNFIINADLNLKTLDSLKVDVFDNYDISAGISRRVAIASNGEINLCHFTKNGDNNYYSFNIEGQKHVKVAVPKALLKRTINHTFFYDNELWISTDNGLYICEFSNNQLLLKNHYYPNIFITRILKDHQSNYWLSTKGEGIFVIPNLNILEYQHKALFNIGDIEKIQGEKLIYGTTKGQVGLFNPSNFTFKSIDTSSVYQVSEVKSFSESNETLIVKEDKVFSVNNTSLKVSALDVPNIVGAKCISKVNDTAYVFSSYKRAELLNEEFDFQRVLHNKRSYVNYYSNSKNSIYVGAIDGLFVFNDKLHKTEIRFEDQSIIPKHIMETANGVIWVASSNNGLLAIEDNVVFCNYKASSGLLSNQINSLKSIHNDVWIVTDEGIQCLETELNTFKNLTKQNGVPSYRVSDIDIIGEQIFFATNSGLFSIDSNKGFKNEKIPEVYVSQVDIGLKTVPLQDYYQLKHHENSIKFLFNANGFQSFINNKYQFRLLGYDNTWQTDGSKANAVNYYNLPSGDYTFQVKSVLAAEDNNALIDAIQFSIARPFWKTWWFYTTLVLVVLLLIYILFRNTVKKLEIKQANELQKELTNKKLILSQLENLRSQMNPHFIFNALNSIQEYIVMNEKDLASSYLVKFSRLIRIYLDHSREDEILLSEEIKALEIYLDLEKIRFEDLLHYEIKVSDQIIATAIKIPSLFIQPYVENAIKHGLLHKENDRRVTIEFNIDNEGQILTCLILDNGIGVEASKAINRKHYPNHKSFATSANEKRVALLNTGRTQKISVTVSSLKLENSNGTKVLITIPLQNESTDHR